MLPSLSSWEPHDVNLTRSNPKRQKQHRQDTFLSISSTFTHIYWYSQYFLSFNPVEMMNGSYSNKAALYKRMTSWFFLLYRLDISNRALLDQTQDPAAVRLYSFFFFFFKLKSPVDQLGSVTWVCAAPSYIRMEQSGESKNKKKPQLIFHWLGY